MSSSSEESDIVTIATLIQKNRMGALKSAIHEFYELPASQQLDKQGRSPLHLAAMWNNQKALKVVLAAGPHQIDLRDSKGNTAVHYACSHNNTAGVSLLLKKGANISKVNKKKQTPLHIACGTGSFNSAALLLEAEKSSLDINAVDVKGYTALHYLCDYEEKEEKKASNSNNGNNNGNNNGSNNGNKDGVKNYNIVSIVSMLVRKGADPSIPTKAGNTAMELALTRGDHNIVTILTNNGGDVSVLYDETKNDLLRVASSADNPDGQFDDYGFIPQGEPHKEKLVPKNRMTKFAARINKYRPPSPETVHVPYRRKKLAAAIINGELTNDFRPDFWQCCLRINSEDAREAYSSLLENQNDPKESVQIDKDINRCMRYHKVFAERYATGQCKLYRVLTAYAHLDSATKYTQGMSTLAAILLIYFEDEAMAFGAMQKMFSSYGFHYYYANDLAGVTNSYAPFEELVKSKFPALHDHLTKHITKGMHITYSALFLPNWMLECYYSSLPFTLVIKVWDLLFLLGPIFMIQVALAILGELSTKLLQTKEADKLMKMLKETENVTWNEKNFLSKAMKFKVKFNFGDNSAL